MKKLFFCALAVGMVIPLYAADNSNQPSVSKKIGQAVQTQLADQLGDTYWVQVGESLVAQECKISGLDCILDNLDKAVSSAKGNVSKATVCVTPKGAQQTCIPALAYAQGGVSYAINNLLYYQGKPITETAGQFVTLVTEYGLHSEKDRKAAMKYFYALLDLADKDCGSGFQLNYGSAAQRADQRQRQERKANSCASEVGGMAALAMLAKDGNEKKEAAERIYAVLADKYDSSAASIVIPGATTALGVLGTPRAYALLEQFLTEDSIPSTGGNILNSISFEGTAKNVLRGVSNLRGGNSRYLNRINENFQYLDNSEASRQGWKSTSRSHEKIQYPYGNLLEDVGRMLATQSKTNSAARKLAKSLVQQANGYAKSNTNAAGDIHYPLVLGILDGWREQGKTYIYEPSPELLSLFYKGDWWDINEGTQRRVHYKAYQFAKARGWTWKAPQQDPEKNERYVYNSRLITIGSGADIAAIPVAVGELVAALPAMAKGISGAVQVLASRKTWINTKDYFKALPATVRQQAAAAVKPKAPAPAAAKSAASANKGQAVASSAGSRTVSRAAAEVKKPVAPKPAAASEKLPLPASAAPKVEPLSGVSKVKIEEKLTGPLADKVAAAKKTAVSYNNRSLMPKTPKGKGAQGPVQYRSDGLVYMEEHPTDPTKAVFYYSDDMGRVNTVKEVPMGTYEAMMSKMSNADKTMLNRIADSYQKEINALRVTREHDRLTDLAKEVTKLKDRRAEIANSRTYNMAEGGNFKQIKQLDNEIAALEKEAERTIRDMSRNGFGSESDMRLMYTNELGHPVVSNAGGFKPVGYAERSLMPATRQRVPEGVVDLRNDGLLYMEAHPTDPTKAVFYYSDGVGKYAKAKEVPMSEYEAFVKGLSEQEKVVLQQSARAYQKEINLARADREHNRIFALGKEVSKKKEYVDYLKKTRKGTAEDQQQIRALEQEIKGLEAEARRTAADMERNKLGKSRTLMKEFNDVQGTPVESSAQRAHLEVADTYDQAYSQVRNIGRQIEQLEGRRAQIVKQGNVTGENLKEVRDIDQELQWLKQEEMSGILQMEKKGMGTRQELIKQFGYERN